MDSNDKVTTKDNKTYIVTKDEKNIPEYILSFDSLGNIINIHKADK